MSTIDLFAGMGGWDLAARDMGLDPLGVEHNPDACATRDAAGLRTLCADISALDPADLAPCEGLIGSPPCQDFSMAGKGAGRTGDRGRLVDEVPRWVDALRPRWVACEQVPPVLPIWQEFARRFRSWGYSAWAGVLSSEEFGVPQTRKRAILMASLDRPVTPPLPTHQAYRHGVPAEEVHGLFGTLAPWVSMAEALGWDPATEVSQKRGAGMADRHGDRPVKRGDEPAFTVTGGDQLRKFVDRRTNSRGPGGTVAPTAPRDCDTPDPAVDTQAGSRWVIRSGQTVNGGPLAERDVDVPAFTVGSRADQWQVLGPVMLDRRQNGAPVIDTSQAPCPTITAAAVGKGVWTLTRPDPRCFQPGGHHEPGEQSENAIHLALSEGLTLQGFPPDFPVQGTKTAQWLQVGNAIPPPLAAAILRQLVDR